MPITRSRSSNDPNPFGQLLGLEFSKMEDGESFCKLLIKEQLLNPYGYVHGGVIYSLADTAMGGALYSSLRSNERCATVEMRVSYFTGVTSGLLECDAKVVHRSGRLGHLEAEVMSDQVLIAKASATFSIFAHEEGS